MPMPANRVRALVPEASGIVFSVQRLRGVAALLMKLYHFAPNLQGTIPGRDLGFTLLSAC